MASAISTRILSRQKSRLVHHRLFHTTCRRHVIKPFLLADIGEGTKECQIIQWFVQPGARVEQFDKLCEVQSDKTASDVRWIGNEVLNGIQLTFIQITSPFDGVIKKLYYEADDMALVGKVYLRRRLTNTTRMLMSV
jgi:2-oxoisovalerate dehydrogenase E2 component (dihydrolipoyl transacylase)